MTEQPEALRIADEMIEWIDGPAFHVPHYVVRDAAKELRRLHEVNQMLVEALEITVPYLPAKTATLSEVEDAIAKAKEKNS